MDLTHAGVKSSDPFAGEGSNITSHHESGPLPPLDPQLREALARDLYKTYKNIRLEMTENTEEKLNKDASFQETWETLAEHLKNSTRAQADDIPRKLHLVGYSFAKKEDVPESSLSKIMTAFTEKQLDFLGEVEHERWAAERMKSGWQSGQRDSTTQQTPFLVPYSELEQKWKDVDKAMVRCYPEILAKAGYSIYESKR